MSLGTRRRHPYATCGRTALGPSTLHPEATRPMALYTALSSRVTIQNITMKNAAMWGIVNLEADNLTIRNVVIDSPLSGNRDGIDVVDCHHVLIEKVTITSEDDSICIKSGSRHGVDDVLGWALSAVAVAFVALQRKSDTREARWRDRVALLLFATVLAMYVSFPAQIGPYMLLLDVRLAVFVALFGVVLLRPRSGARGAVPLSLVAAAALALSAHSAYQVHAFEDEEVGHFDDLLQKLPRGSRLVMLNFAPHSVRANIDPFQYFGSYYRARYGGIAAFTFSEMPHWPVQYRPEWHPPTPMAWGDPCAFRNARDGQFFEFVMTHGEKDPFASAPPGPTWEVVGASRAWRLYRKVPGSWTPAAATPDLGPCAPEVAEAPITLDAPRDAERQSARETP